MLEIISEFFNSEFFNSVLRVIVPILSFPIIFFLILFLQYKFGNKNKKRNIHTKPEPPAQKSAPASEPAPKMTMSISDIKNMYDLTKCILEDIRTYDSDFPDEKFSAYSKKVITLYLSALTQKNTSLIKPFETDDLFIRHKTQIDEYIRNQKTLVIENINIKNLLFVGDYYEKDYRYVSTFVYVNMNRYTIDDKTKKIIKNDPKSTYQYKYMMDFVKPISSVPESIQHIEKCPNCGAPATNHSVKYCEYCGSSLQENQDELCFDGWKLYDITENTGSVEFTLSNVKLPFKL